jgi:hypothetical protein
MKYQVLRGCIIGGAPKMAGLIVEVDDKEAAELMGIGRITPYAEPVVENRAVGLSGSASKPKKRKAKAKKNG